MNTIGHLFRVTTFGESHGPAIGAVIDGCPAGLKIDATFIQSELNRRRPGQSTLTTSRNETDSFEILSGVFEHKSIGSPIAILIPNKNQNSGDYEWLKNTYRPNHADYTYEQKYGIRDYRGGGRSSARATAAIVAAGAIAKLFLKKYKIEISAFVSQVGEIKMDGVFSNYKKQDIEKSWVRCPDKKVSAQMIAYLEKIKSEGDTVGGKINCFITNVQAGLGEPVFAKLQAALAHAMLSINAVKGFAYGDGFAATAMKGSEAKDVFELKAKKIVTQTNHSGGIQGGISNGMPIHFEVAFKPIATLLQEQQSVTRQGKKTVITPAGRHDPCAVPRAVPIVEALTALVLADFVLLSRTNKG